MNKNRQVSVVAILSIMLNGCAIPLSVFKANQNKAIADYNAYKAGLNGRPSSNSVESDYNRIIGFDENSHCWVPERCRDNSSFLKDLEDDIKMAMQIDGLYSSAINNTRKDTSSTSSLTNETQTIQMLNSSQEGVTNLQIPPQKPAD